MRGPDRTIGDIGSDFMRAIEKAALERPAREEFVDGLPGWYWYEQEVMLGAVNAERARNGLPPVGLDVVRKAHDRAFGRKWFLSGWAIACAAIAIGKEPPA